jgi:hypothetical protein
MPKEKILDHLKTTILELKSKMDLLDQNAVRNRKLDFEVFSQEELDQKLQICTQYGKKRLLLTQIGYLRINLFQEYYERIQALEENQDFEKAVNLMNEYIQTIALPYIQERLHPSILYRIANLFSMTLPDADQTLKEWETCYEAWRKRQITEIIYDEKMMREFEKIKKIFITLYTLSFSPSNFPPVAVESAH